VTDPTGEQAAPPRTTRRILTVGLLRAVVATALVLTAYFALPLDRVADLPAALSLPVLLAAFVALMVLQVRAIMDSSYPGLRAVEALAISVPLFLVIFSATYYVMGVAEPGWFSESLSKLDALYFTVTVFTTVGFGDIVAAAPPARVAVMVQMLADLIVLGVGVRVLTGAVREARARAGRPLPGG
jgi:voltage-gated potassium channel